MLYIHYLYINVFFWKLYPFSGTFCIKTCEKKKFWVEPWSVTKEHKKYIFLFTLYIFSCQISHKKEKIPYLPRCKKKWSYKNPVEKCIRKHRIKNKCVLVCGRVYICVGVSVSALLLCNSSLGSTNWFLEQMYSMFQPRFVTKSCGSGDEPCVRVLLSQSSGAAWGSSSFCAKPFPSIFYSLKPLPPGQSEMEKNKRPSWCGYSVTLWATVPNACPLCRGVRSPPKLHHRASGIRVSKVANKFLCSICHQIFKRDVINLVGK